MVSRRTHDRVVRGYERQLSALTDMVRDLNDRLMHAQGVTWTPPPVLVDEQQELVLAGISSPDFEEPDQVV